MGKINFSLKTRRFYKENKTVIDTINKYSNLLLYTNFSYDGQDYLENEESLRFFHKYIMEHRGDLETILRVLNKIEQLKIDEIKLDKHMDFSKEEYELHYWKSENYRYVLLNNLVLVPSGETDLIRYKSTNSDYKIVASRGACKSSYLDAQMASQITLNSLIINPDKLPNDASAEGIYKTVFGLNLRNFIKPYITVIKDYTQEKVFDNALVKSSIMVLDKQRQQGVLRYRDMTLEKEINIPVNQLTDKWFFTENLANGMHRFGDYFKVSHVVATLLNEAYVIKEEDYQETEQGFLCKGHNIERDMVRDTATPRSLRYQKNEKIIFPYMYDDGHLVRFEEGEFETNYPEAAAYLNDFRDDLDERQSDTSAKWYEYGRSQALAGLDSDKLLISTVITENVAVYRLTRECIPYAGMYIVRCEGNNEYTLEDAIRILESRDFRQYVLDVGIHISGSSLRITSKDVEEYKF